MEIRKLRQQELLPALHLVWEVFVEDVAPTYTPRGVEEFQKFIKYENILPAFQNQKILFWGLWDGEELCGVIAMEASGHICLFYVKKSRQGEGIGRMLYQTAYNYCAQELCINRMTVNAAPGAAEKYQHMGMRVTGPEQEENGIRYVPMETFVARTLVQNVKTDKGHKRLLVGGIIAGILLMVLLVVAGAFLVRNIYREVRGEIQPKYEDPGEDWYDEEDPMNPDSPLWDERGDSDIDGSGSSLSGIDGIPAHIEDNLSYEIEDEEYTYNEEETQTAQVNFYVRYPELDGLGGETEEKINTVIRDCAMQTVDEIYHNPTQEFKEKILGTESPMLTSYVNYKVTYASNDFICVMLEDMGTKGSSEEYYQDLRVLNINLKSGEIYQVKDIVNLDTDFLLTWIETMRSEAGDEEFLSELTEEQMKSTLSGKSINGNYKAVFFVSENGIEIGYSLDYEAGDDNDLGYAWVTAPFSFEEIQEYKTDSVFWDNFK